MEVTEIIKKIADEGHKVQTCAAKVVRVNREEPSSLNDSDDDIDRDVYTVDVVRSDGAEINNVRLKSSIQDKEQGIICVPKENSWVLISIIETTETRAFISQYSEIDKIFLRIKNDDDTYFNMQSNGNATTLSFKRIESGDSIPNTPKKYKDISRIAYSSDEVKVDFNEGEGYQALIDSNKVLFEHTEKKLCFKMESKFKVQVGNNNLKEELNELIKEVSKIVVAQGVGPDIGALAGINNRINEIME